MAVEKTTEEAFRELISRRGWWQDIEIDGKPINKKIASELKHRFLGNRASGVTINTMEKYLRAAGYQVVQEKLWMDLS